MKYIKYILFIFFVCYTTLTAISQNDAEQLFDESNYKEVITILSEKNKKISSL